jgi:thiaminase
MAALCAASAPEGHFQHYIQKIPQNRSFFVAKIKKHKKSTAIFQKSIQNKTHFTSTKAKVYFLGVSKSNPFPQNSQILRFYCIYFL